MANSRYGVDRRRVFEMTDSIAMPRRHHLRRTGPARPHLADLVIPIEDHRDLVWLLQHQQTHMLENERDRFRPTLVGRFRKHDAGQRDLALASSQPPLPMGGRLDSCNPRPAGRNCSPRSFVTGSSPDPARHRWFEPRKASATPITGEVRNGCCCGLFAVSGANRR
jgi:hypothetical protein